MATVIPSPIRAHVRRTLLRWYDRNKRDLPWRRRASDPYAQWVAEIMLQQTRVETVIDFYEPFLRRFPTVRDLARADHQDVLKHWEGLGYYRRALQLHRAAKLLNDNGMEIPGSTEVLRRLPGIGEYTAAAIASVAFQRREAAVDGNVARVIARLFGVSQDVLSTPGRQHVRELATQLVPVKRPGDFNQAWMDLGSMICVPKSPSCADCPLQSICVAHSAAKTDVLPVRKARKEVVEVLLVVGVFVHDGRMLVRRRPIGGLWSGLWEFPNIEVGGSRTDGDGGGTSKPRQDRPRVGLIKRLAGGGGISIGALPERAATVRHLLTHRALTFEVYTAVAGPAKRCVSKVQPHRWVTFRGFERLSVSTAHRRILASVDERIRPMMACKPGV
jgi:A/G-specific adenine glycosylase